jgi:hypothetical protein
MSISTEVLNTTFADLRGPLVNSFVRSNELFDALNTKARMPMEGGSFIERSFSGGAPARGVGVYVGDELLNMTRRQQVKKFQVEPHRLVVAVNIPKKELQMNSGKLAVVRLIEEYPQTVMEGVKADINAYMLTGASRGIVFQTAELKGLMTLNGQVSSGIGTGVTNGLLDFDTPANQTDTVQNVAKSSSYFHFNQSADITSWATHGLSRLRQCYRQAAHYAGGPGKGPDLCIMDDDTYANFEAFKRDAVRIQLIEDKTEKSNMLGLDLGVAKVYSSLDLDRTASTFSGVASDGVAYILNTDYIEMPMHEAPNISEFKERVGDQDVVTAIFSMQANLISTKLPAQGVVSGGASA